MIYNVKLYSRPQLQANPTKLFVFGDNFKRVGYGGQAQAARDEPNALGIATKIDPGAYLEDTFLSEVLFREFLPKFMMLKQHLDMGGDVVWPADGIGTGLADLPNKAPLIWAELQRMQAWLFEQAEVVNVDELKAEK